MRRERREDPHETLELRARQPAVGGIGHLLRPRRRVHELDHRCDGGVERQPIDVAGHLVHGSVQQALDRRIRVPRQEQTTGALIDRESPRPRQEPVHARDVACVPGLARLKRPHRHLVQAERVGAVLRNHVIGIDHVAKALGHLGDDLRDRSAAALVVTAVALLDLVDRHQAAIGALVGIGGEHPLMEQPAEGFRRAHVAEVEEHLVPEPRVQQVKHRMLGTAHVQVDAARVEAAIAALALQPVALGLGGEHARTVRGIAVAQVVPA